MSIVSLAHHEVQKFRAAEQLKRRATDAPPGAMDASVPPPGAATTTTTTAATDDSGPVGKALEALTRYIPTEVVAIYMAALTSFPAMGISATKVFAIFVIATPVLLLLTFLGNAKKASGTVPPPAKWPYWKMAAATIAFGAWAVAIPGNPIAPENSTAAMGVVAMAVSYVLSIAGNLFDAVPAEATA